MDRGSLASNPKRLTQDELTAALPNRVLAEQAARIAAAESWVVVIQVKDARRSARAAATGSSADRG